MLATIMFTTLLSTSSQQYMVLVQNLNDKKYKNTYNGEKNNLDINIVYTEIFPSEKYIRPIV